MDPLGLRLSIKECVSETCLAASIGKKAQVDYNSTQNSLAGISSVSWGRE